MDKIYELTVNGKVIACSTNLEWIVNTAKPFHDRFNRAPVILSSRLFDREDAR